MYTSFKSIASNLIYFYFPLNLLTAFKLKNKTLKNRDSIDIILNLPQDFAFDIEEIKITYNEITNSIKIETNEIPEYIKNNIINYFDNDINDYIIFIEKHIETFLQGSLPIKKKIEKNENVNLVNNFKFPINQLKSLNVEYKHIRKNISLLACNEISINVECEKCKKRQSHMALSPCTNCSYPLNIKFTPVVHTNFLGHLFVQNCKFIAFNPIKFYLSCCRCDLIYETKKISGNSKITFKCCGYEIKFELEDVIYKSDKKEKKTIGKELPNHGTCKHYSKSKRWFRFPCCGLLFPCDICHDEKSDHVFVLANKMVCGLCGKEQSVKKECECGNKIGGKSTFWEGGKGTRDKSKMSKKDSKKYKN